MGGMKSVVTPMPSTRVEFLSFRLNVFSIQDRQIVMDEFRLRNIHCFESPRQEDLVALSEK